MARGGRPDKLGYEYERLWVVRQCLRMLDGDASTLQWEPLGEKGNGIEFRLGRHEGTEVHQCKRQLEDRGKWTVNALSAVLESAKEQIERNDVDIFVFVSRDPAPVLRRFTELSRSCDDDPQTFRNDVPKSLLQDLNLLCRTWKLDPDDPKELGKVLHLLQRIEIRIYDPTDIRSLERDAAARVGGEGHGVVACISEFFFAQLGNTIDAAALCDHLDGCGYRLAISSRAKPQGKSVVHIPVPLRVLLEGSSLAEPITEFTDACSRLYNTHDQPFFPFYDDGGVSRVDRTLARAIDLVPHGLWDKKKGERTTKALRAEDAAVLVVATHLCSIAMHVSLVGFQKLVDETTVHRPVAWFAERRETRTPDRPWPELWHEYKDEVRRFGAFEWNAILGEGETRGFEGLPDDAKDWTQEDKLVVGEFLRRHHSRLAHEIALFGLPGASAEEFPILNRTIGRLADLAGTVARSPSLPLSLLHKYLGTLHGKTNAPLDCNAIYLMALLRVADCLQLDMRRAPAALLRLPRPQTPKSIMEWDASEPVAKVYFKNNDPRAIHVHVYDKHAFVTHLQLQQLVLRARQELEAASGFLAELYRGHSDSKELSKARVSSNLWEQDLLNRLPYLPIEGKFDADPHLLTLLATPLYGDNPEIGVRELLQNAVDAVLERKFYCSTSGIDDGGLDHRGDLGGDVVIQIVDREEGGAIVVADRGIGMTAETVQNYFLRAGASLRTSPRWTRLFARHGPPDVRRSGRFGIGVFAAFLLGSRLTLKTRRVGDPRNGVECELQRDSRIIELRKPTEKLPFGTTVEVEIEEEVMRTILAADCWDWYTQQDPRVVRRALGRKQAQTHPKQRDMKWRRLVPDGYEAVHWTSESYPSLTCNGLVIAGLRSRKRGKKQFEEPRFDWRDPSVGDVLKMPNLAVLDREGRLPLTLQRDRLVEERLPFEKELLADVLDDFLAYGLTHAPKEAPWVRSDRPTSYKQGFPLHKNTGCLGALDWFCTVRGVGIADPDVLSFADCDELLFFGVVQSKQVSGSSALWWPGPPHDDGLACVPYDIPVTSQDAFQGRLVSTHDRIAGRRSFLREWIVSQRLALVTREPTGSFYPEQRNVDPGDPPIVYWTIGTRDLKPTQPLVGLIRSATEPVRPCPALFALQLTIQRPDNWKRPSPIAERWIEVLGHALIPFDPGQRSRMVERASKQPGMAERIDRYNR